MITPAQFLASRSNTANLDPRRLQEIRDHIDEAISRGSLTHSVAVENQRTDWTIAEINAVLEEYRAAGWIADTSSATYLVVLTARPA